MNKTSQVTKNWLIDLEISGNALILEALLRRGFLAYEEADCLWLGTGSHPDDLKILNLINGIKVTSLMDKQKDRLAEIKIESSIDSKKLALSILSIPENHLNEEMRMTTTGLGGRISANWSSYISMAWGAKMAVSPIKRSYQKLVFERLISEPNENALDFGIALLVKTLPLARVATTLSCDGHGTRSAYVNFHFKWDPLWASAIFNVLVINKLNSSWSFESNEWSGELNIKPTDEFSDKTIKLMLDDIQYFSRLLMRPENISKIKKARDSTISMLTHFSDPRKQSMEEFSKIAALNLTTLK